MTCMPHILCATYLVWYASIIKPPLHFCYNTGIPCSSDFPLVYGNKKHSSHIEGA